MVSNVGINSGLRILFVVPSYKPAYVYGGPIKSIASLAESLVKTGHHVAVATTTANGERELEVESGQKMELYGVEVIYFERWTKDHSHFSPSLLLYLWKNLNYYDIIHIHSWWNLVAIPTSLFCLFKGIRPVLTPRGSLSEYTFRHSKSLYKRVFHFGLGRRLLRRSFLHSTSEKEFLEISQILKTNYHRRIPNIFEFHDISIPSLHHPTFLKIVFLGRIDPSKNIEFLFEVLGEGCNLTFELNLIGEGDIGYKNYLSSLLPIGVNVNWLGFIDGNEKYEILESSDLLVLPSHTENFGNVVIESLSVGTPVLVSDQVGIKEYVVKNKIGWAVPCDAMLWRRALEVILVERNERERIRKIAPGKVRKDFGPETLVGKYMEMYEEVYEGAD